MGVEMDFTEMVSSGHAAWLCLSKSKDSLQHGGNEGYDDALGFYYSWDSTVQNHGTIQNGDLIAIWNGEALLGISFVEDIERRHGPKNIFKCPNCGLARIKRRRNLRPEFRCSSPDCRSEFDVPLTFEIVVTWYRANYEAGWVPIDPFVGANRCRDLAKSSASQLSLREIDLGKLNKLMAELPSYGVSALSMRNEILHGGHLLRTVRVRIGQDEFRSKLLQGFGWNCAISGPTHPAALEAAHLYSYAEVGTHYTSGGLLLRRDLHRLFDRGLIAVNPDSLVVDELPELLAFENYRKLDGQPLKIEPSQETRNWLSMHWGQFRGIAQYR